MLKKLLIFSGIIIGVIIVLCAIGVYYFLPNKNTVLHFIEANPEKTAIKLVRNDTLLAESNPAKMMPLASTVKIIIAIEYAAQASKGRINPDELVPLSELAKYYVPNTDGGAHPSWLKSVKGKVEKERISIREIAKGIIAFSSNANTEWLCEKLSLQNINNRLFSLGIEHHSQIYFIVSALFVGKEKFPTLKGEALVKQLNSLRMGDYIATTEHIHYTLSEDSTYKKTIGDLGLPIQRVWSDNLPSSTVEEYVGLMKKINNRTYFDKETHEYLDEVMEFLLENPANRKWLAHSGMKGGSTAFVLTKALYATDKQGNKTELAYFIDDLGIIENTRLQMSMNEFELNILTDKKFREEVKSALLK